MEPVKRGMTQLRESLEEIYLSFLKTSVFPMRKKNSTISFTTSVRFQEEGTYGCQESKGDSFSLTVTYRDGEIVSLTTLHSPSIN